MTKSPRFLSQVNHPVRATIQWCLTPNLPLTKYLWSRLMSCHERHSQRLVALSFPIWFWNIFSWLKYWANQKIYQMNKGVCDAFLVLYWCQRDCEFSKGVSIKIRLFVESAYWPIYFQDVLDKCILNTSLCDVVFKWLLQEVSYRAQTVNFSVAVIFLLNVWADWKARSSENMLASWRVGDWTPECCCKQSPEKNHWGILKHCSMSHLVACPKHSASKINRSTDFSGSKVQKQRARWNWHHIAHSSDGGWIYIWSMFFLNLPWISFLLMKNISEVGGGGKSCWQCRTDGRSWKLQGQAQQELAAYIQKNLGKTWPPPNIKKVTQKPAKSHTPFDASATWYQYSGVIFEKKIGKGCFRWLHIVFTKLYLSHLWQFLQSMYAEV